MLLPQQFTVIAQVSFYIYFQDGFQSLYDFDSIDNNYN